MPIVFGTDLSEQSAGQTKVAVALAKKLGESLLLVHVVEPGVSRFQQGAVDAHVEEARRTLSEQVTQLEGAGPVEALVLVGTPDEALTELAVERRARLIVVSSLSRRAALWRLGSTADRLAQSSPLPVLVLRKGEELLSALEGKTALRVAVGAAFDDASAGALAFARSFTTPEERVLLHSYGPFSEHHRRLMPLPLRPEIGSAEIEFSLRKELTERLSIAEQETLLVAVNPTATSIGSHMATLAESSNASLLVVGSHQRQGLQWLWQGSVSQTALHASPRSVLIVPATGSQQVERVSAGRTVLVPTDLTARGDAAIEVGAAMAGEDGHLCLLHVVGEAPQSVDVEALEDQLLTRRPLRARLRVSCEVRGGLSVSSAIAEAAERHGADMIVLATRGRSGLKGVVFGSIARDVMSSSTKTCIVVRPSAALD